MDASPSHRQSSSVLVQIPESRRRATHHGAPNPYGGPQHPPPAAVPLQLQTQQLPSDGDVYDPERLRQMFSQLQAYNPVDGAGQVTSQYDLGTGAGAGPATATARPSMAPNMWTNGNTAHLQPPVFSQEQLHTNPYSGPAVFSEFAAGFAPQLDGFGAARPRYVGPSRPQPSTPLSVSNAQSFTAGPDCNEANLALCPRGLEAWREKLFHVKEMLVLTQQQYQTYWPHIDNVYSHRSTQRYKNRPFLAHYYDCRLKGRPAGTPKSTDPTKKKRKRVARERDLCDVKIKVTEYMPGATKEDIMGHLNMQPGKEGVETVGRMLHNPRPWPGVPDIDMSNEGALVTAFYTIQRVNASAAGEEDAGGSDIGDGGHRHSLEESDRVKKNSVIRANLKDEKQRRKSSTSQVQDKKTYHKIATGAALDTVNRHSGEHVLKLYGSCFCPFVQRVWISLEAKKLPYQYIEVDPYAKPRSLLDVNPRGLVPALRHGDWGCYESTVLMEYLEDLNQGPALLPRDPQARAHCRLWSDHVNRHVTPAFYRYLQEQDQEKQAQHAQELRDAIVKLVDAADKSGPFFLGSQLGFVDVQIAPWVVRMRRVLKPYKGWPDPEDGSRWAKWVHAIETDPSVLGTTSDDGLYLDSYERYAENRPNTSQLANAVNSGRGLP